MTPSEPVATCPPRSWPAAAVAPAVHPIFVQAPEAPRPRGNRAAAGAIGVVAALAFAALYLAAMLGFGALAGDRHGGQRRRGAHRRSRHVVAVGDRPRLLPQLLAARCHHQPRPLGRMGRLRPARRLRVLRRPSARSALPGSVLDAHREPRAHSSSRISCTHRWRSRPSSSAASSRSGSARGPLARGRRVTELNLEAQHEYERTLEAGPQLVRQ